MAFDAGNAATGVGMGAAALAGAAAMTTAAAATAGLVLPILGLASMGVAALTGREKIHDKLTKLFHDPFETRTATPCYGDEEITKLSFSLLEQGFSHIQGQTRKFADAEKQYKKWRKDLATCGFESNTKIDSPGLQPRAMHNLLMKDNAAWLTYVRRLRHLSNYQQACYVVARYKPGGGREQMKDMWAGQEYRAFFLKVSERYQQLKTAGL